jgi:hypothetical protein
MTTSTTTPVEAGTYRHRPSWATVEPEILDTSLLWATNVGASEVDLSVAVSRRDSLIGDTFADLGEPYVFLSFDVDDGHLTPGQARELAGLLIQAADLAEQS